MTARRSTPLLAALLGASAAPDAECAEFRLLDTLTTPAGTVFVIDMVARSGRQVITKMPDGRELLHNAPPTPFPDGATCLVLNRT